MSTPMSLPYADARGHRANLVRRVPISITALFLLFLVIASTLTDVAAAFGPVDTEQQQHLGVTSSAVPNVATVEKPRLQESAPSRAPDRQSPRHNPPTQVSVEDSPTTANLVTSSVTTANAFFSSRGANHGNPPEPVEHFILGTLPNSMEGEAQASSRTSSQQHVEAVYTKRFMPKLRAIYAPPGKRDVLGRMATESSGTAAGASPVDSPQYRTIDVRDQSALDTTATSQGFGGSTAASPMSTTSTVDGDVIPAAVSYAGIPPSHGMPQRGVDHLSWKKANVGNASVSTDSSDAFLPIRIVGSGRTVVKFEGKAGHVISAVVQLKDHRYDDSVRIDNCRGMYLEVELISRNDRRSTLHVKEGPVDLTSTRKTPEAADGSTGETRQPKGADENRDPQPIQDKENNGPSTFWDFFAPMFDNSALCEVLQSVSMRVDEVPETRDYFIVIRSSLVSPLETNALYGNVPRLDATSYTCDINVFIIQKPAARQTWMRLVFALILPLLVLLLPLPCTMWRADMLQQFMLDADFVECMWLLPLLVRKKTVQALKACMDGIIRVRAARQQRRLQTQLLRLESVHQNTTAATMQQAAGQQEQQPPQTRSPLLQAPNPSDPFVATESTSQTHLLKPAWTSHTPNAQLPLPQKEAGATKHAIRGPDAMPLKAPSGSGFGDPHDSTHHCRHHTDGSCSDVTVASPHLGCPSGVLEEDGVSLSSMTSRTQVPCRCCGDTQESSTACEAVTAVRVHVPPLADATENLEDGHRRVRRARNNGYDLLFTTEEPVHAEQSSASQEHSQHTPVAQRSSVSAATQAVPRRPREEEEAMLSGGGSVDCATTRNEISQLMHNGATPSLASPHEPAVKSRVTAIAPGEGEGEEEEEEPFCRICRDGKDVAPLITPCACTGSVRFVHALCLDRWRIESAKRNLANVNQCEICKETFQVEIGRSTLLWESSKHVLNGICLFFACFILIGLEATLTHTVLGEMSCSATYHRVAYRTMFRFEGLSLTIFVYGLMVLLAVSANLIVYSWFRSRSDVEEYIVEMRIAPPFYTQRNKILILVVCFVLLAQVHAMGYLVKYLIYHTTHIAWNWETSPLMGGVLFSLFTALVIPICSWARQAYIANITNRRSGATSATDVVVQPIQEVDHLVPGANNTNEGGAPVSPREMFVSDAPPPPPPPSSPAPSGESTSSPATRPTTRENAEQQQPEEDLDYTRHFDVPPEQRVIRAFEYCPPRRKLPKG